MYTTITLLKEMKACAPGYGRVLSFMGTAPKNKDLKIPLWLIAILDEDADLSWALENSTVFDPTEHRKLLEEYGVPLFHAYLYRSWGSAEWEKFKDAKETLTLETAAPLTDAWRVAVLNKCFEVQSLDDVLSCVALFQQDPKLRLRYSEIADPAMWLPTARFILGLYNETTRSLRATGSSRLFREKLDVPDSGWFFHKKFPTDKLRRWSNNSSKEAVAWALAGGDPYAAATRFLYENSLIRKGSGLLLSVDTKKDVPEFSAQISITSPEEIFKIHIKKTLEASPDARAFVTADLSDTPSWSEAENILRAEWGIRTGQELPEHFSITAAIAQVITFLADNPPEDLPEFFDRLEISVRNLRTECLSQRAQEAEDSSSWRMPAPDEDSVTDSNDEDDDVAHHDGDESVEETMTGRGRPSRSRRSVP
jgi:hypothetical protein